MRETILQNFEYCTSETKLISDLIYGICDSRKVSSGALSAYVSGDAKLDSKHRRIERFYEKGVSDEGLIWQATDKILSNKKVDLSFDRTNWKYGSKHINAFVVYASAGNVAGVVNLKMLDNNGGNSKSIDRIKMAKEVIDRQGKDNINCVLGDREFFSFEFAHWLILKDIPFVLRLRENLEFIQPHLKDATRKKTIIKRVAIPNELGGLSNVDLTIKVLKDEYLILASNKVKQPLSKYKKRWEIERFFRMLKTGGFNLEDSKITLPERIKILFMLCSLAYLICTTIGYYRYVKVEKMRWKKKDRCFEYSYFRWGLDWIKELIILGNERFYSLVSKALPGLQL